jgi:hypothetical protein
MGAESVGTDPVEIVPLRLRTPRAVVSLIGELESGWPWS